MAETYSGESLMEDKANNDFEIDASRVDGDLLTLNVLSSSSVIMSKAPDIGESLAIGPYVSFFMATTTCDDQRRYYNNSIPLVSPTAQHGNEDNTQSKKLR